MRLGAHSFHECFANKVFGSIPTGIGLRRFSWRGIVSSGGPSGPVGFAFTFAFALTFAFAFALAFAFAFAFTFAFTFTFTLPC